MYHPPIPIDKRIAMKKLFETIVDNKTGNRYIAMKLGLPTTSVVNYRHSLGGRYTKQKRVDIPFEKLTPRAKRLVIMFADRKVIVD